MFTWGTAFGTAVLIVAIEKLSHVLKDIDDKQGIVFIFKVKTINIGYSILTTIYGFDVCTY